MGLNIKNPRVHQLAQEAARRTGRSQVSVIEEALERLLAELPGSEHERRRAALMDWFESLPPPSDEQRHAVAQAQEDLYDEVTGLPR